MMQTFKQHLLITEKINDVKWLQKSLSFVFTDSWSGFGIPLVASFFKKHFDVNPKTIAYHISNYENLKRIIAIQNTQKSLSVTTQTNYTDFARSIFSYGVQGGSGIISKLEGTMVGHWNEDVGSMPDEQGRRWVFIKSLVENLPKEEKEVRMFFSSNNINVMIDKKLSIVFQIMLNKFAKENSENFAEQMYAANSKQNNGKNTIIINHFDDVQEMTQYLHIYAGKDYEQIIKKLKAKVISTYISVLQNIMIKYKKEFQVLLFDSYQTPKGKNSYYDEGVMNNFKIKEVLISSAYNAIGDEIRDNMIQKVISNLNSAFPEAAGFGNEEEEEKFSGNYHFMQLRNRRSLPYNDETKKKIKMIEGKLGIKFIPKDSRFHDNETFIYEMRFSHKIEKANILKKLKEDGIYSKIPKITIAKEESNILSLPFFKNTNK